MAEFVVQLYSRSLIRLSKKSYDDPATRRSVFLSLPYAQLAMFDRFERVADGVGIPAGLVVQIQLAATDINGAIDLAVGVAGHALSMMSCVTMCSVDFPLPIWAYESTPGIENREYRYCYYEGTGSPSPY